MLFAKNINKTYGSLKLFDNITFEISSQKSCAIIGRSGEGKSTLLHILGGLENPDSGEILINQVPLTHKNLDEFLRKDVGFIFQNYNLLEDFSILDNLKIASMIRKIPFDKKNAIHLLEQMELARSPGTLAKVLSGGEKQRVAIARALMHDPKIIFADEPTGSLDTNQAKIIEELLLQRVKQMQTSLILVTHDLELASKCDRILHLKDKKINPAL